jgi:hypothetical protein
MATDRREKLNKLPDRLKKVNTALIELNEVVTGGSFDIDKIWGENGEDNITSYMGGLTVSGDLNATVNKFLGGLPGASEVSKAIDAAMSGLQTAIRKIQDTSNDLTKGGAERINAFNRLNDPHAADSGYNYQPPASGNFGFIPAIEGVINSAADTSIDLDDVLGPLKAIGDYANAGQGIADFIEFATASIKLLDNALKVA